MRYPLFAIALTLALPAAVSAQTLDQAITSGSCTTAGGEGLAQQLVRVQICANPGMFAEFTPHPGITLNSSRVNPLGTSQTVTALRAAADNTPLQVSSAFRTLSEQYMLWSGGGCGAAATPGSSNHQSARAVDLSNWSAARSAMQAAGCAWPNIPNDPFHFDCPGADSRPEAVRTFQRLWNHNNPGDLLTEDGVWGPNTRSRLGGSPAAGFPSEPCGASGDVYGAQFVSQTFPTASSAAPVVAPGGTYTGSITLRNTGTTDWDSSTRLGTTGPRDFASELRGADWVSASRPAQVSGTVAPNGEFTFTFTLQGPALPGEYCQTLGVLQEGVAWFSDSGHLGPPDDQLEVCLDVDDAIPATDAGPPGGIDAGARADAGARDAGPRTDAAVATDAGPPIGPGRPGGAGGCGCRAVGASPTESAGWALLGLLAFVYRRRRATTA